VALRTRPSWSSTAPEKAPFLWPKSSLSTSESLSAPQLTATKSPARRDSRCTARATTSLPVPVSPRTVMVTVDGATWTRRVSSRSRSGTRVSRPGAAGSRSPASTHISSPTTGRARRNRNSV
jgi:hypothetical protein